MSGQAVTRLLHAASAGDAHAAAELLPLLYDELRRVARAELRHAPPGATLQPTALVHEAYLRLIGDADPGWNGRGHFFGAAAIAMRRVVVDAARRRLAAKRGGHAARADLDADDLPIAMPGDVSPEDVLALEAALAELEAMDERKARIVVLRHFGGRSHEQIAGMLGVSTRTIEREWRTARAWLQTRLGPNHPEQP